VYVANRGLGTGVQQAQFQGAQVRQTGDDPSLVKRVHADVDRMELTVNASKILTIDGKFTRAQVNNPEVVTVTPLSPNEIQISALKAGVTQIHLWDADKRVYSLDVSVYGDVRELQMALKDQYPNSVIRVYRYSSSLVLKGYVEEPESVSTIVRLAEDYAPKVINNLDVGGTQQGVLHVQVMEVSRTKLRTLGFYFANLSGDDFVISSITGLIDVATSQGGTAAASQDTVRFGIVNDPNSFFGFIRALRQNDLMKILSEPKIVTVSGRPASFNVGGEFPVLVPQSLGTVSIEYKKFGTQVDVLPIVLGNGKIRIEVRPRVSEIDSTRSVEVNNFTIPGLRVREIDTGVEMQAGQVLALGGLVQNRIEAQNKGLPYLSDLPFVGAAFRSVEHTNNEIELLILVRPELVAAMDPHEVPPGRPGLNTVDPTDSELYWKGYLEVPRCPGCTDPGCPYCNHGTVFGPQAQPHQGPVPQQTGPAKGQPAMPGQPSVYQDQQARGTRPQQPVASWNRSGAGGQAYPPRQRSREMTGVQPHRSPAQPRTVYLQNASTRHDPTAPQTAAGPPANREQQAPGLIGPSGYDVMR